MYSPSKYNEGRSRHRFAVRLIACFVLVTFISFDISWANGVAPALIGPKETSVPLSFRIPPDIGHIEEISLPGDTAQPVIYHLQDAHAVYQAQNSLAKIIEYLVRTEKASTILVEGGAGDVSLGGLRRFAPRAIREKVAAQFLKEGKISGEEFYELSTNDPLELLGIEDRTLYRSNSEALLKILARKSEALKILSKIESVLRAQEASFYPPPFRRLRELKHPSAENHGGFFSYLEALRHFSIDFKIPLGGYPEWEKFWAMKKGETPEGFQQEGFLKEIKALEKSAQAAVLVTPESRRLADLEDGLWLLRKEFGLELAYPEYQTLTDASTGLRIGELSRSLKEVLADRDSKFELSGKDLKFLQDYESLCLEFYRLARLRDRAFGEAITKILEQKKPRRLILITGGFHSAHLGELIRQKGIGRVLISPNVTAVEENLPARYAELFREKLKSTLRMPASAGTPVFAALQSAFEREAQKMAGLKAGVLTSLLNVDRPSDISASGVSEARKEIRQTIVEQLIRAKEVLAAHQDALLSLGVIASAVALGTLFYFIWKWMKKTSRAQSPEVSFGDKILPRKIASREDSEWETLDLGEILATDLESPPDFEKGESELLAEEDAEEVLAALPRDSSDLAVQAAFLTRDYFLRRLLTPSPSFDLPAGPELDLPAGAFAIPDEIGTSAKLKLVLDIMLREMEGMDYSMRFHQKDAASKALERALGEKYEAGFKDRYERYLDEAFRDFQMEAIAYTKSLPKLPENLAKQPVNREIEMRFPYLPKLVKLLLSRSEAWKKNPEILSRLDEILRKLKTPPPIAEDLISHVQNEFHRILSGNEDLMQSIRAEMESLEPSPEIVVSPESVPEFERKLALVESLRQEYEEESSKVSGQVTVTRGKLAELEREIKTVSEPGSPGGAAVVDALTKHAKAYAERIGELQSELAVLMDRQLEMELKAKEISRKLDQARGPRSEVRGLEMSRVFAGVAAMTASVALFAFLLFYLAGPILGTLLGFSVFGVFTYGLFAVTAIRQIRVILQKQKKDFWPFKWQDILNVTAPPKAKETVDFYKGEKTFPVVTAITGFFILPFLSFLAGQYLQGAWAASLFSMGLTFFCYPFLGVFLGFILPFLIQLGHNYGPSFLRLLKFPFDYRALFLVQSTPAGALDDRVVARGLRLLARMDEKEGKAALRGLVQRFGYENLRRLLNRKEAMQLALASNAESIYRSYALFEQAKSMLARKYGKNNPEEQARIFNAAEGWVNALDKGGLSGAQITSQLIMELEKRETDFARVNFWMKTLIRDPKTPWKGGTSQVIKYYENIVKLKQTGALLHKKFGLTDEEFKKINEHIGQWLKYFEAEKDWAKVPAILSEVLRKVARSCSDKESFQRAIAYVTEMAKQWFSGDVSIDAIVEEYDEAIGFRMIVRQLAAGATTLQRAQLQKILERLEGDIKEQRLKPAKILPAVFDLLQDFKIEERIDILHQLTRLRPKNYVWNERAPPRRRQAAFVQDPLVAMEQDLEADLQLGGEGHEFGLDEAVRDELDTAQHTVSERNLAEAYRLFVQKEIGKRKLFAENANYVQALTAIESKILRKPSVTSLQQLAAFYKGLLAEVSVSQRLFVLQLMNALPDSELLIFVRDFDIFIAFYQSRPEADYEHLPALLTHFRKRYGKLEVLTSSLLSTLTDPSVAPATRLVQARKDVVEQIVADIGFPAHVAQTWDAVGMNELIRAVGSGDILRRRAHHPVVERALTRMGEWGLYSYWQAKKPAYYKKFLEETSEINPQFFAPGEKFRVAYDREDSAEDRITGNRTGMGIIADPVEGFRSVLEGLKKLTFFDRNTQTEKNYYDTVVRKFKDKIEGGDIERHLTPETAVEFARELLRIMGNWKVKDEGLKTALLVQVCQIVWRAPLEPFIAMADLDPVAYWKGYLEIFRKEGAGKKADLKKNSRYYLAVEEKIEEEIARLVEARADDSGREGLMQFILTRGSPSDFYRGEISRDCTAEDAHPGHFPNTIGLPTDPAFLSFKLVEDGRWIGNIYSMLFLTPEGESFVFVDQVTIHPSHALARYNSGPETRRLAEGFITQMLRYLAQNGVDYLVMSPTTISSIHEWGNSLISAAQSPGMGGKIRSVSASKPGGMGHRADFGNVSEYLQGLGTNISDRNTVHGLWLKSHLDKMGEVSVANEATLVAKIERLKEKFEKARAHKNELLELQQNGEGVLKALETKREQARLQGKTSVVEALMEQIVDKHLLNEGLPEQLAQTDEGLAQMDKELRDLMTQLVRLRQRKKEGPKRAELRNENGPAGLSRSETRHAVAALFKVPSYRPSDREEQILAAIERYSQEAVWWKETSEEELLDMAEVRAFYDRWEQEVWRREKKPLRKMSSGEARPYLELYFKEIEMLRDLVKNPMTAGSLASLDAPGLFEKIYEAEQGRKLLEGRWENFGNFFSLHKGLPFSPYLQYGNRREFVRWLETSPGAGIFFQHSLAPYYRMLRKGERLLKKELRKRIATSPAGIPALFRHLADYDASQNRPRGMFSGLADDALDWLIKIKAPPPETEISLRGEKPFFGIEQVAYQGTPYRVIFEMLARLRLTPEDVFYDLGSGYGRVPMTVGMMIPVRKAIGIELVPERVRQSEKVRSELDLKNVEFREGNVRGADFSDGTVFFLFNPFSTETLRMTIDRLHAIAERRGGQGKSIRIVSWGPSNAEFIRESEWLKVTDLYQYNGLTVMFFESVPEEAGRSEIRKTFFKALQDLSKNVKDIFSRKSVFLFSAGLFAFGLLDFIFLATLCGLVLGVMFVWLMQEARFKHLQNIWQWHELKEFKGLDLTADPGVFREEIAEINAELTKKKKELAEIEALLVLLPRDDESIRKKSELGQDIAHLEERLKVLRQAVVETELRAGREKLKALLAKLPEELWQVLRSHFPNVDKTRSFQMTVDAVSESLVQAWRVSAFFRKIIGVLENNGSFYYWFGDQPFYKKFKEHTTGLGLAETFDHPQEWVRFQLPQDPRTYSLQLSLRDSEYLLRGMVSGDCTNCGPMYVTGSFITATGTHISDPGFLNFKLMRDGDWIGNVYAMVIQEDGRPVLVVDAIQIPWENASPLFFPYRHEEVRFPVASREVLRLSEGVLLALAVYSQKNHFQELWLSGFVSNFDDLKQHFHRKWPRQFDRTVTGAKKVGAWEGPQSLGYEGTPYVESIHNGKAKAVWQAGQPIAGIRILQGRNEIRTAGSGYELNEAERELLRAAIDDGEKTGPYDISVRARKLIEEDLPQFAESSPGLEKFVGDSVFRLVRVKPEAVPGERVPSAGLGVRLDSVGRDVYTAVETEPRGDEPHGYQVTFYVGDELYNLSNERMRDEIFAGLLYQAYREASAENNERYPLDIDLEVKIDEEIRRSEAWENLIEEVEKRDLGLLGGTANRRNLHVRGRAFSRFFGEPASDGIGTSYTQLLRQVRSLRVDLNRERAADEPGLPEGAFDYLKPGAPGEIELPDFDLLFRVRAYLDEHKNDDLLEYVSQLLSPERRVLMLHSNAPSPWILEDVRKIIAGLMEDGVEVSGENEDRAQRLSLKHIYLDLDPRLEPLVAQYFQTGRVPRGLLEGMAARFSGALGPGMPEAVKKDFERPDLYMKILQEVYQYNRESREENKIKVHLYYPPRQFPPMPGQGFVPPGMPGLPVPQGGGQGFPQLPGLPFPPQGGRQGGRPALPFPPMPVPQGGGQGFPQFPGMPVPPQMGQGGRNVPPPGGVPQGGGAPFEMPIRQEIIRAIRLALGDIQREPNGLVLFLKPVDEFSANIMNHPAIASVLHIDKYTGFGPEKPENSLALFMSEQASPTQKTFGVPILRNAPFYEDSINPGVPQGIPFNQFKSYPQLIVSTSGEGEGKVRTEVTDTSPEGAPLVPVGPGRPRAEIRSKDVGNAMFDLKNLGLNKGAVNASDLRRRELAIRRLVSIGNPAIVPLVRELKRTQSLSVKLGILQVLAAIAGPVPGVMNSLTPLLDVPGLRRPVKETIRALKRRGPSKKAGIQTAGKRQDSNARATREAAPQFFDPGEGMNASKLYTGFSDAGEAWASAKSVEFLRQVIKSIRLMVDFDVSSLVRKENGKVRLIGWGFFETLKSMENHMPAEIIDRISVRLVNLNPDLSESEILRALGISPELRGMVEIQNVPVKHYAYQGVSGYLRPHSLKIVSEASRELWEDEISILVKEPKAKEAIDGRKLFLTTLLHATLRRQIPDDLKTTALKLLREMGSPAAGRMSTFSPESEAALQSDYLQQLAAMNRMLSTSA